MNLTLGRKGKGGRSSSKPKVRNTHDRDAHPEEKKSQVGLWTRKKSRDREGDGPQSVFYRDQREGEFPGEQGLERGFERGGDSRYVRKILEEWETTIKQSFPKYPCAPDREKGRRGREREDGRHQAWSAKGVR